MIRRTQVSVAFCALKRLHVKQAVKTLIDRLIRLGVPRVLPEIVRTLPHDTKSFTQGLLYHGGLLYESVASSTGSSLRCLHSDDGSLLNVVPVEDGFVEGIAVVGDRLFQLSWKSGRAHVYRFPELVKIGEVAYEGEGWGLTASPTGLIMSNGSSTLYFRNEAFKITRVLHVRSNGIPVRNINDIERVNCSIFANILNRSDIFEISLARAGSCQP